MTCSSISAHSFSENSVPDAMLKTASLTGARAARMFARAISSA